MKTIEISWKPDRTSKVPIYSQIVEYVTAKIQKGDWVEGERLPSQRRLSELFGVNRSTIVTAMEELLSYGIVESMGAAGTRISGGSWSLRLAQPPDWNQYIKSGPFKANRPTIQMINRMEFEQGYIRIGTGELSPDLYPKELVRDILNKLPDRIHSLNYLGTLGLPELREELCTYLEREQGIRTSPDNILITSGSLQALQLISICMLKRGATVYTEAPTYLKSLQVFQSAGMNMAGLPMDEEGMRYGSLRGKDLKDSIVYTIPSFHNPTGQALREFFGDLKESGSAATWDIPGGGFYIWLRFAGKLPMDKIFYEALHRGVLFNPGNVYDYAENNAIRVSYAWAAPEELRQAIRILSEIIRKYI
ncbi:MAG: PLP-dependent aminotransferase family protein [Eubacterium sp.]|nr:PLP-dependent aminotransferase family protein [Eubacterium sp.]